MTGLGERAAVLMAAALALTAMVGPAAAAAPELAAACSYRQHFVPTKTITYLPPWTDGDRDFAGHGPNVHIGATLFTTVFGNRQGSLNIHIVMGAFETRSDWTDAFGEADRLVWRAESGWLVDRIVVPYYDDGPLYYTDTDHAEDVFPGVDPDSFVKEYRVVGDTDGDDAGVRTRVKVTTKHITLRLVRCT